jgi:hypothetical protein
MRKVKLKILTALQMEAAMNQHAANIDPAKEGAEEVTYILADALAATGDALAPFHKRREIMQRQHRVREGEPPPDALVEALDKAAEKMIEIDLPEPLTRSQAFSVLRVPVPSALARLGPMLGERKSPAPVVAE